MKFSKQAFRKAAQRVLRSLALACFLLLGITSNAQVVLNITDEIGAQNVAVDFTVENWNDIAACQLSVNWDPARISLDSLGNFNLPSLDPGSFNINNSELGFFPMAWVSSTGLGTDLNDGDILFTMYFDVLVEGYTPISITDSPTPIEVADGSVQVVPYVIDNGSITGSGNLLQGNVYHDSNDDCANQSGEEALGSWLIKLEGTETFYTSTDENGNYSLFVNPDNYVLELMYPNELWLACDNLIAVDLTGDIDPTTVDIPVGSIIDCPLMQVDISTPFLRRCFDNNYYVNYCNIGTVTTEDASVEIEIDEYLTVLNSSIPFTINSEGLYVFDVEELGIGECGSFNFSAFLDCDSTILGQTHCVSAHAYPDSICIAPNNSWSGASLKITGECVGNEIEFTIENIGENMIMESQYIVIEDAVMFAPNTFSLNAGGNMTVNVPANGSTYRLEVGQVDDHPGLSMPSLSIEGCGTNSEEEFSLGFVTLYPEDDNDPWISIDCQENIGSYDPNDKAAAPAGYGDNHFIKPNTDLEYKIRFQNTGTDTAFTVVIEDSLSVHLNPTTIRPGASSHPYNFELTDQGLVRFTFENIMLPDSNVNEVASHGFVKFRIAQSLDLPDGTIINNQAGIYFDFNDAVLTNTTFHEVQRDFIEPVHTIEIFEEGVEVNVFPNPFSGSTNFEIKGKNYKAITLKVFDAMGREISTGNYDNQLFEFSSETYSTGLHFYQIWSNQKLISTGKLIMY